MKLLTENPLHGHCMLKIKFCRICNDEFLLITTGTDGKAIFWQITNIELSYPENASVKNNLINKEHFKSATDIQSLSEVSLAELQLHQSGITALAVIQKSETADSQTLLMATGGDDTAISISTLEIKLTTSLNELSTNLLKVYEVNRVTINVVHTAQITGTKDNLAFGLCYDIFTKENDFIILLLFS